MKIYEFSIPTAGTESYSIKADSLEQAISKLQDDPEKYLSCSEVDWDLGWGSSRKKIEDYLDGCYEVDDE